MVPEDWSFKSLDSAKIKVVDGDRGKEYPKAGDFLETGYCLFLSAKNVTKAGFLFEELQFINEDKDKKLRKGRVERGNIVLTTRGSVGQFAYFDNSVPYDVMRINSGMVVIDATQSELLPEFFYALCRSFIVGKQIEAASFGSAQPQLTVGIIKGIKLPIPPLPEQKKIAQILSTWDKAIATTEQLLANSQQQKKALMQQLLTGKKRLLDKSGVRFSGEWSSYLLEKLEELGWVMLGRGNVISKIDIENTPGDYPIYSSSVKNNGLMGKYGEHMFDEELITWSVDGGGNFFYRPKHKFSVTNVSGYMRINTEQLNYQFIAAQLEMHHSKLEFDYQSKAHPSVIRKIYTLAIPTLEEQQKIAAVLSTADQEISALQQKLDALKQEKKALMQQLLTGKRRVKLN